MGLSIESYIAGSRVTATLFTSKMELGNLMAARENARLAPKLPFNCEFSMLPDMVDVLMKRDTNFKPNPYWLPDQKYNPLDIFIAAVEFFDRHKEPIPHTTTPPEKDVQQFINFVLNSDHRLTVPEQLDSLLKLSGGNVIGAANIGFLSSRLLARGWDTRAYPNIPISPEVIRESGNHFAQFESSLKEHSDSPGDTYYFWTHFFAASAYYQLGCPHSRILNKCFGVGTPVMRFVRKYFAGQETISEHFEASQLGRHTGIAISELSSQIQNKHLD